MRAKQTYMGRKAQHPADLPPCGGDARQGRGGYREHTPLADAAAAPPSHPPLPPLAPSPPHGRSEGVRRAITPSLSAFKRAALIVGLIMLFLLWAVLLPFADRSSFSVHMIAHMGVVAGAAPLIAIGLSGTRFDFTAGRGWLTPLTASLVELFAVWAWHVPAMRGLSETSAFFAAAEQAVFLGAGLALWLSCLGGAADGREERRLSGTFGLLFTSMHMTLLGALLSLSPRPLYGEGVVICFGVTLTAAADQQAGGVIMLMVGAAVYLAGGVALLARTLNGGAPEALGRRDSR
ncbi:cytochrome c oxidase assembly protein [Xaviernesmea oryzae]|uniref:cytochrome c oxidase assembly protein n=1 Tax=Xaviernesmea oryzae TaxID=464029 RepID=UPI0030786028